MTKNVTFDTKVCMFNKIDKISYTDEAKEHNFNNLKQRYRLFAENYVMDRNASNAARIAGYSPKTAGAQGSRLLKHKAVKLYIAHLSGEATDEAKVDFKYVITRLKDLATDHKDKNPSVSLRALELLGKHIGMFEPKIRDLEERPAFVGININMGPKPSVDLLDKHGNIIGTGGKKLPSPTTPAIDIESTAVN